MNDASIQLAHGGGGQLTAELIAEVILPALGPDANAQNPRALADAAYLRGGPECSMGVSPMSPTGVSPVAKPTEASCDNDAAARADSNAPLSRPPCMGETPMRLTGETPVLRSATWAFTTDSYVVWPLEFPGGDIGKLAVCGTVNDLAVSGADAAGLSLSLVLEEGLEIALLRRVLASAGRAARQAGVRIVTGDTKVVERGGVKGMILNTSGVGTVWPAATLGFDRVTPGDKLILSGPLGEHGLAVLCQRQGLALRTELASDCAPLNALCRDLVAQLGPAVKCMRDPTRGGLAAAAVDLANACRCDIELDEAAIPQHRAARAAADMLGLDLLTVANEGKLLAVVSPAAAEQAVAILRAHDLAPHAAVIGAVTRPSDQPLVELLTTIASRRVVPMPYGEELPRIC
ncbi:MAG: hydrogenase expression/formation protein HypE [Phycisphaerae bacterium]|nr:hydrogenase expression/formation protein HypE [Phycisphaerae bacterium]